MARAGVVCPVEVRQEPKQGLRLERMGSRFRRMVVHVNMTRCLITIHCIVKFTNLVYVKGRRLTCYKSNDASSGPRRIWDPHQPLFEASVTCPRLAACLVFICYVIETVQCINACTDILTSLEALGIDSISLNIISPASTLSKCHRTYPEA
jgi:hypothetical protein